jgi:tetratricopeptide (TPR) repeat protein
MPNRLVLRSLHAMAALGVMALLLPGSPVRAQSPRLTVEDHIAAGIAAPEGLDPEGALSHFEAALALDSLNYEATWRAAFALLNIGKRVPDTEKSAWRDSLYARAEQLARRAVDLELLDPEGHYVLGMAIGRTSLTLPVKERALVAREIRVEALKALELDPEHDGAYHVLGRWHWEIRRLSGFERFFAKNVFGAKFFDKASWEGAVENLTKAVELNPGYIYHRLKLAELLTERKRYVEARAQLEVIPTLPTTDYMDPTYREQAAQLERRIAGLEQR